MATRDTTTTTVERADTANGTPFTSDEGRFSVVVPKQPKRLLQQQPAGDVVLDVVLHDVAVSDAEAYQVAFVDYPESLGALDARRVLEGAVDGAAARVAGTVESETFLDYRGRQAVDSVISVQQFKVRARTVLAGRRLYVLQQIAAGDPTPAYDTMLETFQIHS